MATVRHYLIEMLRDRNTHMFGRITNDIEADKKTLRFYARNSLIGCEQYYKVRERLGNNIRERLDMLDKFPYLKGVTIDIYV